MKNPYAHILKKITLLTTILWLCSFYLQAQEKKWTLDACIKQACKENIVLNQAIANNEINKVNYLQSKANIFPNLNLTDVHSLENGKFILPTTNQYTNQSINTNSLNLISNVTLFNGMKNNNLIKENKLNYEAGNMDVEKMKNDLTLNVIAAYMQVLFEYEAVDIAESIIEADTEHYNYTQKYVNAGSLPESNLLQVAAQLATDKAAKVDAENQLMLSKVTLMQLMEIPVNSKFEIERPAIKEIVPDISLTSEEIYNTSLTFLPEIKSATIKSNASEIALKISKSEIIPKLTLSGNLNTTYSSNNSLYSYNTSTQNENIGYLKSNPSELVYGPVTTTNFSSLSYPFLRQFNDNFGQGISLNLSIPIYNNRLYRSDIKRATIAIEVAKLNEQYVKNQLRKNIEQAYTDQVIAGKNLIASKDQLVSEQRSFHDMEIKFKAGTINATDFFVEKSNYNKAEYSNLSAKYQYLFKTKIVSFYTGMLTTQ